MLVTINSYGLIEYERKGMPAVRFFHIVDDTDNLERLITVGRGIAAGLRGKARLERVARPKRKVR